jgi:hypothetical protein
MNPKKIQFFVIGVAFFLFCTGISCKTKIDPIISITDFIKNNPDRSSFTLIRLVQQKRAKSEVDFLLSLNNTI